MKALPNCKKSVSQMSAVRNPVPMELLNLSLTYSKNIDLAHIFSIEFIECVTKKFGMPWKYS